MLKFYDTYNFAYMLCALVYKDDLLQSSKEESTDLQVQLELFKQQIEDEKRDKHSILQLREEDRKDKILLQLQLEESKHQNEEQTKQKDDLLNQVQQQREQLKKELQQEREELLQLKTQLEILKQQKSEAENERNTQKELRNEERRKIVWLSLKHGDKVAGISQQIAKERKEKLEIQQQREREVAEVTQQIAKEREEKLELQHQREREIRDNLALLAQVNEEKDHLQQQVEELTAQNADLTKRAEDLPESWVVSYNEVKVMKEKQLGSGAYGYVAKGVFRGQVVAVKQIHDALLDSRNVDRVHREIRTMATVRHPNLVLFIAAVLDNQAGPMIITELLDTSLRKAYEEDRLGDNSLNILRDIASALSYLHRHHTPIIHRDVSSANVLLEAMANSRWKAKLSDFGSANLVKHAVTAGEGAIIYTAPEAFPVHYSLSPKPQTPKVDVYSYGVLVCEVLTKELPDPDKLAATLAKVKRTWPQMHTIVKDCIEMDPEKRPVMSDILAKL